MCLCERSSFSKLLAMFTMTDETTKCAHEKIKTFLSANYRNQLRFAIITMYSEKLNFLVWFYGIFVKFERTEEHTKRTMLYWFVTVAQRENENMLYFFISLSNCSHFLSNTFCKSFIIPFLV